MPSSLRNHKSARTRNEYELSPESNDQIGYSFFRVRFFWALKHLRVNEVKPFELSLLDFDPKWNKLLMSTSYTLANWTHNDCLRVVSSVFCRNFHGHFSTQDA